LLALLPLLAATPTSAADLYRYINDEGNVVVDYSVPPEFVSRGYEVLNEDGTVIRVVPRALTEEEKKQRNAEQKQAESAEAEQRRLREWDESLMRRYSTIEDIEDARDRALQDLRIRVSILKSNRRSLKQQVENYQAQAADLERSGKEVDLARIATIEDLQDEIASTERSIADREREINLVAESYERDIERFGLLLDVVERRRALSLQGASKED
jgi:chromosome segregation ATPase